VTRFTLQDALAATGAVLAHGDPSTEIAGVSTDTRSLRPGELFLALTGPNFDGNRFAGRAEEAGAGALLLRDDADVTPASTRAAVLLHADPHRALADLAGWYRSTFDVPVVGITGSCGKTTTKNVLAQLVESLFPTVASPSSFNNDIGVPLTLLLGRRDTRLFAIEMGTNNPGEIAALSRIARPTVGVVTNIGAAHLEGLGSVEGVAREKGDLIASLPREGLAVLNADCRFTPQVRTRTAARVVTFGVEGRPGERGDLNATDLHFEQGGTTFRLEGREVRSPLLGTHNVHNLLAALAVCRGLGIELDDVLPAVARLRAGRQRMERIDVGELVVFDDTYNSNPDSLRAALNVLSGLEGFGRRVLVLGDMLELGARAAELHHRLGREAAEGGVHEIVLVGELARAAAAGALEAGVSPGALHHFGTTEEVVDAIGSIVRDGDVVLVKGSRRMRLEAVVEELAGGRDDAG